MSIPKSKILSVQKGVMANTKVNYGSSKQSQSVTVNIVKENDEKKNDDIVDVKYGEPVVHNPYANLPPDINTIIQDKDRQLEALNIIINIMKNNPLIMNKYVIANYEDLLRLIQLLTNADDVQIIVKDVEIGCFCTCDDPVITIDKIYVVKHNESFIFKQSFANVVRIFDEHKISLKMVAII